MNAVLDFFVDLLERLGRFVGIGRRAAAEGSDAEPYEERRVSGPGRVMRWLVPVLVVGLVVYVGTMFYRFDIWRGVDLAYPQAVMDASAADELPDEGDAGEPVGGGATECSRSAVVDMQIHLIDLVVNRNDWVPATPQYKIGIFGLVPWSATPFFDNKASFQIGILTVLRRFSLDLADTIGRVRGTSGADPDLQGAASRLRVNERAWVLNSPFDRQLQAVQASAAGSYRGAIPLYERFNARLADCDALFDARADNLLRLMDRISADLGDTNDRLQKRSRAEVWSHEELEFVPGEGNDRGWFDFRADNIVMEARGQLYALHGLLQAVRVDFATSVRQAQLDQIWDRLESHVAEGARFDPLIVSNGATDGLLAPDHLSAMGEKVLRARANMVELRDVLQN
ncbi:MAG: DUF2333 family protein [Paracoccaceae bacterium]